LYDVDSFPQEEISTHLLFILGIYLAWALLLIRTCLWMMFINTQNHTKKKSDQDYSVSGTANDTSFNSLHWRFAANNDQETAMNNINSLNTASSSSLSNANNVSITSSGNINTTNINSINMNINKTDDKTKQPKYAFPFLRFNRLYWMWTSLWLPTSSTAPIPLPPSASSSLPLQLWDLTVGLFASHLYQWVFIGLLKAKVNAPRPNFHALEIFSNVHADLRVYLQRTSHRSFPSGHSSSVFAGLGYVVLVFLADARYLKRHGQHTLAGVMVHIALVLLMAVLYVGATRIIDYLHFANDVIG
jgi:membrane-associated phospholipid phosphatase